MRFKFLFLTFIVLTFCTCVSTSAIKIGTSNHPAIFWQKVVVYRSFSQVPGRYEEVALLSSAGDSFAGSDDILISMKKKAASFGANAIILGEITSVAGATNVLVSKHFLSVDQDEKLTGQALAIYVFPEKK